jgi:hypothetical protein
LLCGIITPDLHPARLLSTGRPKSYSRALELETDLVLCLEAVGSAKQKMSSTIDSILAAFPRERPQLRISRDLLIGAVLGLTLTLSSASLALWMSRPRWWTRGWEESGSNTPLEGVAVGGRTEERSPVEIRSNEVVHGVLGLIGVYRDGMESCECMTLG